jgi:hypothetical protein
MMQPRRLRPSRRGIAVVAPPLVLAAVLAVATSVGSAGAQSSSGGSTTDTSTALACPGQATLNGETVSCDGSGAGQVSATVLWRFRKRPELLVAVEPTAAGVSLGSTTVTDPPSGSTQATGQVDLVGPGSTGTTVTTSVNLTITGNGFVTGAAAKPKPKPKPQPQIEILSFSYGVSGP